MFLFTTDRVPMTILKHNYTQAQVGEPMSYWDDLEDHRWLKDSRTTKGTSPTWATTHECQAPGASCLTCRPLHRRHWALPRICLLLMELKWAQGILWLSESPGHVSFINILRLMSEHPPRMSQFGENGSQYLAATEGAWGMKRKAWTSLCRAVIIWLYLLPQHH